MVRISMTISVQFYLTISKWEAEYPQADTQSLTGREGLRLHVGGI